jgi:hypothetical protein
MAAVPIRSDPTRPCGVRIVNVVVLALFPLVVGAPDAAQEPLRLELHRGGIGYRARAQMYADAARSCGA